MEVPLSVGQVVNLPNCAVVSIWIDDNLEIRITKYEDGSCSITARAWNGEEHIEVFSRNIDKD